MTNYTKKDRKNVLHSELKQYEATIGHISPEERKSLYEWVAAGNQAICNPYCLCEENGNPMDYITAIRLIEDMNRHPENYCE